MPFNFEKELTYSPVTRGKYIDIAEENARKTMASHAEPQLYATQLQDPSKSSYIKNKAYALHGGETFVRVQKALKIAEDLPERAIYAPGR